jgi:hypothetical protein
MAGYFINPNNGLSDLFGLKTGLSLRVDSRYLADRPETLRRSAGDVTPCIVTSLASRDLSNDHQHRIFAIHPIASVSVG